jgi:polysaccharide pyruvyl transferase WcaK-like protein
MKTEVLTVSTLLDKQDRRILKKFLRALQAKYVVCLCWSGLSIPLVYSTFRGLLDELLSLIEDSHRSTVSPDARRAVTAGGAPLPIAADRFVRQVDESTY